MKTDLFEIAWYLLYFSGFFVIAEMIGIQLFWRFFYIIGFKVYNEKIDMPIPSPKIKQSTVIKMEEGKFKFTAHHEVLFISKIQWFKFFRFHTPFPIKCMVTWKEDGANVSGRLPLGSTLFFFAWFVGWSFASIQANDFISGFFGIIFGVVMPAISLPIEKRRMEEMIAELILIIKTEK